MVIFLSISKITKSRIKQISLLLLFPLTIIYFELVFRFSTVADNFSFAVLPMLLFSCSFGFFLYLIANIFKNRKINYAITVILLILCAIPYLIEYFVYRQFKVFYDLNTIFGGAGDMMGGFFDEVVELVFSLGGIIEILLFLLPAILYLILGRKFFAKTKVRLTGRVVSAAMMIICYMVAFICVQVHTQCRSFYTTEYSYHVAVEEFGLVTGIRLDMCGVIFGTEESFEELEVIVPVMVEPQEEKPIEYGYNKMELDLSETEGAVGQLNQYVSGLEPSKKNEYTGIFKGKNLIMITAEAFTAEVIDPKRTPTLYRMATSGIQFTDYYQPDSAGTTGGEYQNIFGMLPSAGGVSFKKTATHFNYMTMGSQLDRLGYYGQAFHNNSYDFYSRDITHINLGYSNGYMGYGNGMEKYVKYCWPQSDLEMIEGTLPLYIDKQPFNIYYMTVSGHSNYGLNENAMARKNWGVVANLPYSDKVKGYLGANQELENAMAYLVKTLEEKGIADDTVICIAADHFPYGLDADAKLGDMPYLSELYGYEVSNYLQRDHSRLIIWSGSLEKKAPIVVDTPTFSLDILPTLSNLFGTEFDSRLFPGRDVFSDAEALVYNYGYDWRTEYGTYIAHTGKFYPNDESVELPAGYVEQIRATVRNKMNYCKMALNNDYFRHLFDKKK